MHISDQVGGEEDQIRAYISPTPNRSCSEGPNGYVVNEDVRKEHTDVEWTVLFFSFYFFMLGII